MNYLGFLQKRSKSAVILIAAASMAVVAIMDYWTGVEISFSIFYLIPVAMLTWFCAKGAGLSGAAVCTVLWFAVDRLSGHEYSHGLISVGISADLSRGALPGKAVIWVEDSGIGMSPEERRKITAGFFRADEAQKVAAGFGIGLKITRELIQAHGGELELDSERGRGTKASFRLPIVKVPLTT